MSQSSASRIVDVLQNVRHRFRKYRGMPRRAREPAEIRCTAKRKRRGIFFACRNEKIYECAHSPCRDLCASRRDAGGYFVGTGIYESARRERTRKRNSRRRTALGENKCRHKTVVGAHVSSERRQRELSSRADELYTLLFEKALPSSYFITRTPYVI